MMAFVFLTMAVSNMCLINNSLIGHSREQVDQWTKEAFPDSQKTCAK